MIRFVNLSRLPIEEMVDLWNRGFENYFANVQTTADRFLNRVAAEGLSLERSFAAFEDDRAIGFVVNGFRTRNGKTLAWNGGTAIVPDFRGQGYGKILMERNMALYEEAHVDEAWLEAVSQNERAIRLYASVGYETVDRLGNLQHTGALDIPAPAGYAFRRGLPDEVRDAAFDGGRSPWQTQAANMGKGECVQVLQDDRLVGYALYKKAWDDDGRLSSIHLYQCEADPGRRDGRDILLAALTQAFRPLELPCRRTVVHLRKSHELLWPLLAELRFEQTVEQVHMRKQMRRGFDG
ncbi:GNAT family N-acetyltransferase [Paenibacillaceae bacterium WGS1546]|uniref:GNAT family N-acetyltransferase n=1 Tax=Cohnella sp. WGS1546 TaxID=3366810 RepID=UPI00372D1539